jgi:hypothetical protein
MAADEDKRSLNEVVRDVVVALAAANVGPTESMQGAARRLSELVDKK